MTTAMSDPQDVLRLMAWMSPVFPTGGFAYSAGLETAVHTGLVKDEDSLHEWLFSLLRNGSLRNDAIFTALAWGAYAEGAKLHGLAQLAFAMASGAERCTEISAQGEAFVNGLSAWPDAPGAAFAKPYVLPICVGQAASHCKLDKSTTILAFAQSQISNQLQAAIRLSVLGQTGAARLLAKLEPAVTQLAVQTTHCELEDLHSCAILSDIAAMNHQHQSTRMFRS